MSQTLFAKWLSVVEKSKTAAEIWSTSRWQVITAGFSWSKAKCSSSQIPTWIGCRPLSVHLKSCNTGTLVQTFANLSTRVLGCRSRFLYTKVFAASANSMDYSKSWLFRSSCCLTHWLSHLLFHGGRWWNALEWQCLNKYIIHKGHIITAIHACMRSIIDHCIKQ